jgi:hypothetical protein
MELKDLINHYGTLKNETNKLYADYKNLQMKLQQAKRVLENKLNEIGLKSAKSQNFGVSIATKPNITIQHEQSVLEWLKTTPNIETDVYIGLKTTAFKGLALQVLKETGEIIPGTELNQVESLTIRNNKKR